MQIAISSTFHSTHGMIGLEGSVYYRRPAGSVMAGVYLFVSLLAK